MNTNSQNYRSGSNLGDSLIEISKTLDSVKGQRFSLEKQIENEEIYKEKLIEKLRSYEKSLDDKTSLLDVYSKILRESDEAYSKIVRSTEALYKMVQNEEKKVKTTTTKKFDN